MPVAVLLCTLCFSAVGMGAITCAAWMLDPSSSPTGIAAWPSLPPSPASMLDFGGFWSELHTSAMITAVTLFVAIFDTAGVQFLCGMGAGLMDNQGKLPGSKAA